MSAASNAQGSLAVTKPAGLAAGDYLLAWQVSEDDNALSGLGGPSGWSLLGSEAGLTSGGHPNVKVWGKVATSTDAAASSFTFTNSDAANDNSVAVLAITAGTYNTTTPVAAGLTFQNGGSAASTAHTAPSVSGVVDGLLVCAFGADTGGTAGSYTAPSGMTERADTNPGTGGFTVLSVATLALTAAGATNARTATCSVSAGWKGVALVVNPSTIAGGGGGAGGGSGGALFAGFLDGQTYPVIPAGTTTVNVSSSATLTTALTNAVAGQRILLGNATYSGSFSLSGKNGTSTAGISVEAASTGGAVFASGSTFSVTDSAYVTLKGLSFPYELGSGNTVQFRGTSHHCRVTRCLFGPTSIGTAGSTKATYVFMSGAIDNVRIDHNELRFKTNPGNAILGDGDFNTSQAVRHIRIDHNYIHDIRPEADNEKEPIRLGVSTMSKTMSYSAIERNVFEGCIAEPEIVSVKAGGVRVSGNTFLRSIGGPVYRHGTDGVMSDNYVIDDRVSSGGAPPPPAGGAQTLGVGGVATPAGAILATSDTTSALTITTSGTAGSPRVYDGQGHTVGRVTFDGCQHVIVQNYNIRSGNQYGVVFDDASNVTLQNCDIANVRPSGDGDLNAITLWGGTNVRIKYNTAINFVGSGVDPGGSHTDWLQTWVSSSHPTPADNVEITNNKAVGPANPSRSDSIPSIHQWIMIEGQGRGGNSGGSGHQDNWYIADNEVGDSWNQAIKVDAASTGFIITRNNFAGSSDRVIEDDTSGGIKFYSDNRITGNYGSVGMTVTSGSGPATVPF